MVNEQPEKPISLNQTSPELFPKRELKYEERCSIVARMGQLILMRELGGIFSSELETNNFCGGQPRLGEPSRTADLCRLLYKGEDISEEVTQTIKESQTSNRHSDRMADYIGLRFTDNSSKIRPNFVMASRVLHLGPENPQVQTFTKRNALDALTPALPDIVAFEKREIETVLRAGRSLGHGLGETFMHAIFYVGQYETPTDFDQAA